MNAKTFGKWLLKHEACEEGAKWAKGKSLEQTWAQLERADWMMWLYRQSKKINKKACVKIAVFCAEQSLINYEKAYPNDNRPRLAIEAARTVIEKDTKENRSAARSAARSAESAAWSAASSAWSAGFAAESAARSAGFAADKKICDYIRTVIKKVVL